MSDTPNLSQSEALRAYHDLVTTYLRRQDQGNERLEAKFDKVTEEVRSAFTTTAERIGKLEAKLDANDTRDLSDRLNKAEKLVSSLQAEVENLKDRPAEGRSWIGIAISILALIITVAVAALK